MATSASVFMSYARRDSGFARRLTDALTQAQRPVWVDWQDLPATADWGQEIFAAIEAADTFLIILSPDTLASETCRIELAHAAESKKRIVPIVCRDVDSASVDPILSPLNWIFARPTDDFDHAVLQIITALDLDLNYWHLSSQLLTRARQWEASGRNRDYLLRGRALDEAERWLALSANKQPGPTALQVQFVSESRHATVTRQRGRFTFITASYAVLVLLLILLSGVLQSYVYQVRHGRPPEPPFALIAGLSLALNAVYTTYFAIRGLSALNARRLARSEPIAPSSTVFVSYSRTNADFVDKLEEDLQHQQFKTWVDRRRVEGGRVWRAEIRGGIEACAVVVVVLSPDALRSPWVSYEWKYAHKRGKPIVPLMYYPCPVLPQLFRELQWLDFQVVMNYDTKYRFAFGQLVDALDGLHVEHPVAIAA